MKMPYMGAMPLDNAVHEYKQRRQGRLDAAAVKRYRLRRDERLGNRLDADEEEGNEPSGGSHGNTRIPFGLCQREGIKINPSWTPKEAWKALEGYGYSAGDVYKELKANGKVSKRVPKTSKETGEVVDFEKEAPIRKPVKKLDASHFPTAMVSSPTYKKNTMQFVNYLNEHCKDPDTAEFLSASTMKGAKLPPNISCRRVSSDGAQVSVTRYRSTGQMASCVVSIPNFDKISDPAEKAEAMRTFAHEWTHFIDLSARNKDSYGHFSADFEPLQRALAEDGDGVGEEAMGLFKEFQKQYDAVRAAVKTEKTELCLKLARDEFGDGSIPKWIRPDGSIDYATAIRSGVSSWMMRDYEKKTRKIGKEVEKRNSRKRSALMDGVASLQGLYDSMHQGELRAKGITKYGHDRSYFRHDKNNRAIEMLADYVALKAMNPKLLDVFVRDHPKVAEQLNAEMLAIVKKMRGEEDD